MPTTCLFLKPDVSSAEGREARDNHLGALVLRAIRDANLSLLGVGLGGNTSEGIVVENIKSDIVPLIYQADVVVIDVTQYEPPGEHGHALSPHLFYFMAVSHSLANKTILVASDSTNHLPPSLITDHTLKYSDRGIRGIEEFENNFERIVANIFSDEPQIDNPIQGYLVRLRAEETTEEVARLRAQIDQLEAKKSQMASEPLGKPDRITFRPISRTEE